jgi:hypothetical protein
LGFENRLTQAVVPSTNGGSTTSHTIPSAGRIQKSGRPRTTNYLDDGLNLLKEFDNGGNILARCRLGDAAVCGGDTVKLATGVFICEKTDLSLLGLSPLNFTRT